MTILTNDNIVFVSQLSISKLPPRPTWHVLHLKMGQWTVHWDPAPTTLEYFHLAGQPEPQVASSLYSVQPLPDEYRPWLVEKDLFPIQQILSEHSEYLLKDPFTYFPKVQKTRSKSGSHWIVTRRIHQKNCSRRGQSQPKQLGACFYHSNVPDVGIYGTMERSWAV